MPRFTPDQALARLPGPGGKRFSHDLAVWVLFYGPEGGEAGRGAATAC